MYPDRKQEQLKLMTATKLRCFTSNWKPTVSVEMVGFTNNNKKSEKPPDFEFHEIGNRR